MGGQAPRDARLIDQLGREAGFRSDSLEIHRPLLLNPDRELQGLFTAMLEMRDLPGLSPWFHDCLATELVVRLLTSASNNFSGALARQSEAGRFPLHFARAKMVMREQVANPDFSLDDLATACGLSKFHFMRMFKRSVGVSPLQYMNLMKVDMAKSLLLKSGHSIGFIAQMLGFADLSTFTKLFKRFSGVPASGFRCMNMPPVQATASMQVVN